MPNKSGKSSPNKKVQKPSKEAVVNSKPRRLKQPKYKSFRIQKRIKHPVKLPNAVKLTKSSFRLIWQNKKLLLGITLVYGILNLIFVRGIAGGVDLNSLKESFDQAFSGHFGSVASGFGVFITLLGSSGNSSNETAGAYQAFLGLVASLVIIYALRQLAAGSNLRIRDAYYQGTYPLVPFILVLLFIGVQLIPMLAGVTIYSLVVQSGIAVGGGQLVWLVFCLLLSSLSVYFIASSIFALYIVTLPDMTPINALRSASDLVRYRRGSVIRKLLWLPFVLLVIAGIVMIPIIIWLTALAQWAFFILAMLALLAVHTYMYTLYRELLND